MVTEQAVILAGGRGERLRPFTDSAPKPLYPVKGVPFISRIVSQLQRFGFKEVLVLLGYRADQVIEELGDGSRFGLRIDYDVQPESFDTGDRLKAALPKIRDVFLLCYCDNYCPVDIETLSDSFLKNRAKVQLTVYSNKDGYTKSNLRVDPKSGQVTVYDKTRKAEGLQGVEIGYSLVRKEVLGMLGDPAGGFSKEIFPRLAEEGSLFATVTDHRYYSIGSFERMPLTELFFSGRKAAFLDRDGTLNVRAPRASYIEKPEDLRLLPGAGEAVRLLQEAGYLTVLVSNQPGIARGRLTEEDLSRVHERLQALLHAEGASLDRIYYCPHNWDEGCDCRKPKPGLLYQAQHDLSIDLTRCVLFGDDERDVMAGNAARVPSIMVSDQYPLLQAVKEYLR
ncbi:MAG: HAD-IIIA family hydrolase [Lachnospiraceae bacterium]|nr:HAD-IIIA family hydrolase [Lachnospiraceae bacterium]